MSSNIPAHIKNREQIFPGSVPTTALGSEHAAPQNGGASANGVLDFFTHLPLPAFIYQPQSLRVLKVNPRCPQHYGYSESEMLTMVVIDFHPAVEHAAVLNQITQSLAGASMTVRTWHHQRKNGELLEVEVWATNIELDGSHCRLAIINDITEKKKIEGQLRESNERFELAAKASRDAIYEWSPVTNELFWTTGLTTHFGWQPGEITFDRWSQLVHPDDIAETLRTLNDAIANPAQEIWNHEYRFRHQNGQWQDVQERCYMVRNDAGDAIRCIGVLQDITEQKRLEQALVKKELERQKIIGQATIDSQEKERAEIGRELHDNVNQILTTTKLYLDLAQSNAELRDDLLQKASSNVMHVINEIRYLSRSLADPSIGDLGLVDSVKNLVADIRKTRLLHVRLHISGAPDAVLEQGKKLMVFRIIQEALNNIVRHAQATEADIHISHKDALFQVIICDNGIGLKQDKLVYGAGLNDIKNRVYLVDGNFQIEAEPARGIKLSISFKI